MDRDVAKKAPAERGIGDGCCLRLKRPVRAAQPLGGAGVAPTARARQYPVTGPLDEARELHACERLVVRVRAERTDWAKDMFVVDTVRRINMPVAKLSLEIASRIDDAASSLSARAEGSVEQPVKKAAAKKRTARRVRRAA